MEKIVTKLWGSERWLHNDKNYCMKELYLEQGARSSLHMHKVKQETFLVTFGIVRMEHKGSELLMHVGDYLTIMPGEYHRFQAYSKIARVVEASTFHDDADVYRIEDSKKVRT